MKRKRHTRLSTYLKEQHGLTLYQLADKMGISYNTMQKYSQGLNPSPDRLQAIAETLDVDRETLKKEVF